MFAAVMKLVSFLILSAAICHAQNGSLPNDYNSVSTDGLISNSSRYNTILRVDNGTYGPQLEEVHYFYKYWPVGIAVSSQGRIFVTYTRGEYDYTLAEVANKTSERPYPSQDIQLAPDQLNTTFNGIPFGSDNASALNSVQALHITPASSTRPETLWLIDTGRPTIQDSTGSYTMPYAQPGGPKLIGISLDNDTITDTYTFPPDVHFPDSYLNDLRFDLRPTINAAYLVDSSNEGRPGFIMVNLTTGDSWRRLSYHPSVLVDYNALPVYQGHPWYYRNPNQPRSFFREGLDGIQISPDGAYIYYSPLSSQNLYRVPTANLLAPTSDPLSEQAASNNVSWLGQRGGPANGFEGDTNGRIYMCMPTQNAVFYWDERDLGVHAFVRDPRIIWPDGASIGQDGYIYVIVNQLPYMDTWNNGVNARQYPGTILRARLPDGGSKITGLV
ncbi:uncharacterized protein HMPREF1541_10340 [Cyphellophora europaea CBS 101466]|uniref:SMP-30/Gluconolactonase/LRE-like region domain-containing protein n=1 Tax=Cyphellophora europaea (strain CBS 101466) TaxID=1220924 RepID=W2S7R0_CYPE1|nr:uncharacterized protein HMPREF1541_10340 [Cyphellophora europaea CBS 101466]ETN44670.1 hypothetical protein HMPREF1541_10340 [Cyphellophora europaea CBS 101466]